MRLSPYRFFELKDETHRREDWICYYKREDKVLIRTDRFENGSATTSRLWTLSEYLAKADYLCEQALEKALKVLFAKARGVRVGGSPCRYDVRQHKT